MTNTPNTPAPQVLDDEALGKAAGGDWTSIFGDIVSWLPGGIACATPPGATHPDEAQRLDPSPDAKP